MRSGKTPQGSEERLCDRSQELNQQNVSSTDQEDADTDLVAQLREALASRTVIGQATGILMERFKINAGLVGQLS